MAKSKKAPAALLEELHNAVTQNLLNKIKSGEADGATITAALKLLKDNKIEADLEVNTEIKELIGFKMPVFTDDEA